MSEQLSDYSLGYDRGARQVALDVERLFEYPEALREYLRVVLSKTAK
ncbi:hypothetical protein RZS08_00195 [Arthrospira platensis SPKY1]|nr:hypothetical protein [Arthrospira platensis SPKY1]